MSINKVILLGRLGRDPELKYSASGNAVCNFSLATSESWKDKSGEWQEKTEWHNVVIWGKPGEAAGNILRKGALCSVEGKITTRKWQDRDGNNRYTTEIVADRWQIEERKRDEGHDAPARSANSTGQSRHEHPNGPAFPSDSGGIGDMPF